MKEDLNLLIYGKQLNSAPLKTKQMKKITQYKKIINGCGTAPSNLFVRNKENGSVEKVFHVAG